MRGLLIFICLILIHSGCRDDFGHQLITINQENRAVSLPDTRVANGHLIQTKGSDFKSKKKKKKRVKKQTVNGQTDTLYSRRLTSESIETLRKLEQNGVTPDFSDRATKRSISGNLHEFPFPSMITLSKKSGLIVNFDNDIFDYTDRFYTNGIRIDLITPLFQANPVNFLLPPYPRQAVNYYGLSVVQNMYTPSTTKTGGIKTGDRPYAAYLYAGFFKITNDTARDFRMTSELDLGIIGPDSYGEWVQRSFHNSVPTNNEPLGWEYQIRNDLVLNYSIALQKGLVSTGHLELIATGKGSLGTLYTNISGGIFLRTGWLNNWFSDPLPLTKQEIIRQGNNSRPFQFSLFLKANGQLTGYDATLQGGMFDKTSVYTIPDTEISRVVFNGSAGLSMEYLGIGLDLEQFLLSPEFHDGLWHKWVHIALKFSL
jgi:hypothetical protein